MITGFRAEDVRAAEEPLLAGERGFSGGLMHRAATALAGVVLRELRGARGRVVGAAVVGLVGPGNNGGDTLHALAVLAARGVGVTAVLTSPTVHEGGLEALRSVGGRLLSVVGDAPGPMVWAGEALAEAFGADVVLDGLLGIGARGGLRGPSRQLVQLLQELQDIGGGRRPFVVAVDVPSGIGVDDGSLPGPVLRADVTVTFGAVKAGLVLPPASALAGRVEVVDLGLGPVLERLGRGPVVTRLEAADLRALWPVPGGSAHKYTRGVVGVVAGSTTYPGAAVLAVAGALGAGCGMVRYVGPRAVADAVRAAHPEVVAGAGRVQAWVVGPGVAADDPDQGPHLRRVLSHAEGDGTPVVVDAGALAALPDHVGPLTVLTPHAGELAALVSARGVGVERSEVEADPLRWVHEAQRLTGATVLLKGATTLVAGPGTTMSQAEAPPWLATAGAGDVLAGVLGALLAGTSADLAGDPTLVARLAAAAASVHGRAATAANPGGPVTASAVAAALPAVVAELVREVP